MRPYIKVFFYFAQSWFTDRSSFSLNPIRLRDSFFGVKSDSINRFENSNPIYRYSDFGSDLPSCQQFLKGAWRLTSWGLILMRKGPFGGERVLIFLRENQHVAQSQCQKLAGKLCTEHTSRHEDVLRQDRWWAGRRGSMGDDRAYIQEERFLNICASKQVRK